MHIGIYCIYIASHTHSILHLLRVYHYIHHTMGRRAKKAPVSSSKVLTRIRMYCRFVTSAVRQCVLPTFDHTRVLVRSSHHYHPNIFIPGRYQTQSQIVQTLQMPLLCPRRRGGTAHGLQGVRGQYDVSFVRRALPNDHSSFERSD